MTGKFQLKGGIYEPSLDTPLNWSDMRSMFGYKLLSESARQRGLTPAIRGVTDARENRQTRPGRC